MLNHKYFRGFCLSFLSFLITILFMVIIIRMAVQVRPALAKADGWFRMITGEEQLDSFHLYPEHNIWMPPSWYPEYAQDDLWMLEQLHEVDELAHQNLPRINSRAALVFDLDRGEILYEKNADSRWPVASLTKVISGLTLASVGGDLDKELCLDRSIDPNFPGAGTFFFAGRCTTGWDLLGSALVKSDNGAAFALSHVAEIPHDVFVEQMNKVAADLLMGDSEFVDPAGLHDENLSTARDITKALVAASQHPGLSMTASSPFWDTKTGPNNQIRRFYSTNRLVSSPTIEVLAAKTGYTSTAKYCYSTVIQKNGRRLAVTTLGAERPGHRWSDVATLLRWSMRN